MPSFQSTVKIMDWQWGNKRFPAVNAIGTGRSKKMAEQEAAEQALVKLKEVDGLDWPNEVLTFPSRSTYHLHGMNQLEQNDILLIQALRSRSRSERAMELLTELFAELLPNHVARATEIYEDIS
jgi:Double-stranded RNA binding motif